MADYSELLNRWAADKYNVENVISVDFEPRYVEGCPTCGGDTFIEVWIAYKGNGKQPKYKSEKRYYGSDLINEILEFAEAKP